MTHIATSTSGVTVAVGWYTKICSTPANSLATWTARTASGATTFYWNGCYFLNGKFWIVGSNSNVYNSTDGTTWTLVSGYSTAAGTYATPTTVDYYNGTYVISGNGSLVTSTDGVTWTSRSAYGQPGYGLLSIGWCGSKWVLVNNVYAVYTTTDFTTYTQVNAKPTSMVVATAKVMIPGTVTNSVVGINTAAAVFSDVF
jgi:photosystem II stability/assembly factor-like uncharacterized protein